MVGEGPVRAVVFSKKEGGINVMGIFVFSKYLKHNFPIFYNIVV